MSAVYQKHGVRFEFPPGWVLTEDGATTEVCITVASPQAAFWSITLFFDCPSPDEVSETVIRAFQDEYQDIDVYPTNVPVGGQPAVGADIEFIAFDLTNSAFVRVCRTNRFTAVVLYQGTDHELVNSLGDLETISESVEFDPDLDWPDFEAREAEAAAAADSDDEEDGESGDAEGGVVDGGLDDEERLDDEESGNLSIGLADTGDEDDDDAPRDSDDDEDDWRSGARG